MNINFEKLISTFLILLLVVAPLHGVVANTDFSNFTSPAETHSIMTADGNMNSIHHDSLSKNHCSQGNNQHPCANGNSCDTQNCSNGHCVSCVFAVISQSHQLTHLGSHTTRLLADNSLVAFSPTSLYRPPRA